MARPAVSPERVVLDRVDQCSVAVGPATGSIATDEIFDPPCEIGLTTADDGTAPTDAIASTIGDLIVGIEVVHAQSPEAGEFTF